MKQFCWYKRTKHFPILQRLLAKGTEMFHKQIKSIALLLSYVFVLGKSQVIANHSQTEIVVSYQ